MKRIAGALDPYILALLGAVLVATLLPPTGVWAEFFDHAANAAIVLLFFLHGAKLSRQAILAGALKWRLHLAVLGTTFLAFPLIGLAMVQLPGLAPVVTTGLLFLTLLPSTVQSSIAFTAMARGDVAAALCSASFSNLLGIVLTPLLAFALMGGVATGFSPGLAEKILLLLLLPFVVGHLLRPLVGSWVARHSGFVSLTDRGSIILIVYVAFGAAVTGGLWRAVSTTDLMIMAGMCLLLLAVVMAFTHFLGKLLKFPREDAVVLFFCGSKKSLASGVPIAGVLFPAAIVGQIVLPLLMFHQMQLIVCAIIARRMARSQEKLDHQIVAN